jgi:hypothetical protein
MAQNLLDFGQFSGGFVPYFDAMGEEDVTIQNMARNMAPKILDRTSLSQCTI